MAIQVIESRHRPQQGNQQEKESLLELLTRGLVGGASQSLGSGLGNLATQGLGMLMDPNQKRIDAKTLEGMGIGKQQAQSIANVKSPQFQRELIANAQKQQADLMAQQQEQGRMGEYMGLLNQTIGGQPMSPGADQQLGTEQQTGIEGQPQTGMQPSKKPSLLKLADAKSLADFYMKQKALDQKDEDMSWKATEETHKANKSAYDASNEMDVGIKKMRALDKANKLDSPEKSKLLGLIGMEQWLDPESQYFNKIRAAYMAGAPKAVGGKVSNDELKAYMARFPSLMNSKEGRALMYEDILMMNELAREPYEIERQIVKENKGKRPRDLDYQIEERMASVHKKYEQRFLDSIEKSRKLDSGGAQEGAQTKFKDMPSASSMAGKTIRSRDGRILKSNGKEWVPQGNMNQNAPQQMQSPGKPMTRQDQFPLMVGDANYGEY
jgi:hypothetical protein